MTTKSTTDPSSETVAVPRDLLEKLKALVKTPIAQEARPRTPPATTSQRSASFADIAASTPTRPASPRAATAETAQAPPRPASPVDGANASANAAANAIKPFYRYPPIVVEKLPNWPTHLKKITEALEYAPNVRPYGEGVRFLPKTPLEYRVVQRYLVDASQQDSSIHWHCYTVSQELPTKVALRGLPTSAREADIMEALKEKGFEATYVKRIPSLRGRPSCVYYIQLAKMSVERLQELYSIDNLLYMPGVRFEGWRGLGGVAQCHRCQAFGHSSHNCHRPPKCVRCAGEHIVADCPRPRSEPATCVNCGRSHAANNRHCKAYRREARLRNMPVRPPPPPTREQIAQRAPMPTRATRRQRQRPEEVPPPRVQAEHRIETTTDPDNRKKNAKRGGRQVQRRRLAANARAESQRLPQPTSHRTRPTEMCVDVSHQVVAQPPVPTPRPHTVARAVPSCNQCGATLPIEQIASRITSTEGTALVKMMRALLEFMKTFTTWEDNQAAVERVEANFAAWESQLPGQEEMDAQ